MMKFNGKFKLLLDLFGLPQWYVFVPKSTLVINFIFQRIFRQNNEIPFSINFKNRVRGYDNFNIGAKAKICLAINGGIYLTAFKNTKLRIGEDTLIASNVAIMTGNHGLYDRDIYNTDDIEIGNNCWLGYGSVILPGVKIGNNVTVGANTVVTRSFPDNLVLAGCPARIVKVLNIEKEGQKQERMDVK